MPPHMMVLMSLEACQGQMRQHKSVGSGEETEIDRLGDEATCGSLTGRRLKLRVEGNGAAITGANGIALDI